MGSDLTPKEAARKIAWDHFQSILAEMDKAGVIVPKELAMRTDYFAALRALADDIEAALTAPAARIAELEAALSAATAASTEYRNYAAAKSNQYVAERKAREAAEAEAARLREALRETLAIACRNERGDFEARARAALGGDHG